MAGAKVGSPAKAGRFAVCLAAEPEPPIKRNFSLLNRIAVNLLKQETTLKSGTKGKRLKAAWDPRCLLKLPGI
jgi:hypothetical protein